MTSCTRYAWEEVEEISSGRRKPRVKPSPESASTHWRALTWSGSSTGYGHSGSRCGYCTSTIQSRDHLLLMAIVFCLPDPVRTSGPKQSRHQVCRKQISIRLFPVSWPCTGQPAAFWLGVQQGDRQGAGTAPRADLGVCPRPSLPKLDQHTGKRRLKRRSC